MIYDANVGIGISVWILARTNVGLKKCVYLVFRKHMHGNEIISSTII